MQSIEEAAGQKLQELGQEIRARRKSLGWSREKLCEEADVSLDSVKRLEGGANTRADKMVKMLLALDMATTPTAPDSQQIKAEIHRLVELL